jgi:rubrerythrin
MIENIHSKLKPILGIHKGKTMKTEQLNELLYQALETEAGGVQVYETAIRCAVNPDLKEEWQTYLEQTRTHEQIAREMVEKMGLDPAADTPGRQVVRHKGESLVEAMTMALKANNPEAAQLVAAECVVTAETKDHQNWELIGQAAEKMKGSEGQILKEAYELVEDQEDEHLYHNMGWSRELWMDSLGLPAVLPPPEEEQDVQTAEDAAHAKKSRKEML